MENVTFCWDLALIQDAGSSSSSSASLSPSQSEALPFGFATELLVVLGSVSTSCGFDGLGSGVLVSVWGVLSVLTLVGLGSVCGVGLFSCFGGVEEIEGADFTAVVMSFNQSMSSGFFVRDEAGDLPREGGRSNPKMSSSSWNLYRGKESLKATYLHLKIIFHQKFCHPSLVYESKHKSEIISFRRNKIYRYY